MDVTEKKQKFDHIVNLVIKTVNQDDFDFNRLCQLVRLMNEMEIEEMNKIYLLEVKNA